jgi:hypothetical protein
MDKVRKPSNSVCYTPSSEPSRIYMITYVLEVQGTGVRTAPGILLKSTSHLVKYVRPYI